MDNLADQGDITDWNVTAALGSQLDAAGGE
jgi:hypothetical protein